MIPPNIDDIDDYINDTSKEYILNAEFYSGVLWNIYLKIIITPSLLFLQCFLQFYLTTIYQNLNK